MNGHILASTKCTYANHDVILLRVVRLMVLEPRVCNENVLALVERDVGEDDSRNRRRLHPVLEIAIRDREGGGVERVERDATKRGERTILEQMAVAD